MKCPKCQFDNPKTAKFCVECGNKLELKCSNCGLSNSPSFKFCAECGQNLIITLESAPKELSSEGKIEKIQRYLPKGLTEKILSQKDKIEGEHKQVTVMFCDMEGFTAISERIGPEETYSVMDQVYEILIHKVHDYEGTVNELTGDGILALFGAPIALEDAPQRAIRSALAIHREMVKFSDKIRSETKIPPIRMRIGIHTGPVVVGTVGNDLRVEFKAVGDTVNLASRMEETAEPGTTYVTGDIFKLTEGLFRFESLGDRDVKGKNRPVEVYRVLAPSSRRTRFDVSSEQGLTFFVGRERELELLLDGYKRAEAGRGQVFSIVAEAGIGKSRLLYEFRKAIANDYVTFLEGKSLSYGKNVAYHPIIDILKSNFGIREGDSEVNIEEKVKTGLRQVDADEATALPYLLALLSVKESGIDKILISPEAKKARTIDALKQIVLKGSEMRPLIIAIEDLHWIDKSSEESLKKLMAGIPGARVLLIFTYRPEYIHNWGGKSYHSQITLNRISNRESLAMVAYLLGTQEIDGNLEDLILEKTEGVPFFIEEFVNSLLDIKIIEKKDDTFYLADNYESLTIPSRIQDVVMTRVDTMPENAKEILQIGSVIGREFSHELLRQIVEFPQQELLSNLSILKDSELIYERGIYPKSTYIIKHALTQESIYKSLLKSSRQKHHRKIAEVLEQHFPEIAETQPETLGHHFKEAGLAEKAITYCQQAGDIAIRRSANVEAIAHLTTGLEILETLPESPDRHQQELKLQIALGVPLKVIKGNGAPEVEQTYKRALKLCQQVDETSQLFPAMWGLWLCYLTNRELQTAKNLGRQLLDLSKRLQDPDLLLEAHHTLWTTLYFLGEFTLTQEHVKKGMTLYNPILHRSHTYLYAGHDSRVCCQATAARTLWFLGYPDKALYKSEEALIIAEELDHAFSLSFALSYKSQIHMHRKEYAVVKKLAERYMKIAIKNGFEAQLAMAMLMLNWVSTGQEGSEENIEKFRKSITTLRAKGLELAAPFVLVLLAEAYLHNKQIMEGLAVLDEAMALVAENGVCYYEAELYRIKAELIMSQSGNDKYEAESYLEKALAVAHRQHSKSLELRALISLCRLRRNLGKIEEARCILSDIYGWFTEGFDTADLKDAKALLDELR